MNVASDRPRLALTQEWPLGSWIVTLDQVIAIRDEQSEQVPWRALGASGGRWFDTQITEALASGRVAIMHRPGVDSPEPVTAPADGWTFGDWVVVSTDRPRIYVRDQAVTGQQWRQAHGDHGTSDEHIDAYLDRGRVRYVHAPRNPALPTQPGTAISAHITAPGGHTRGVLVLSAGGAWTSVDEVLGRTQFTADHIASFAPLMTAEEWSARQG